jgi:hypothetical protein
VGQECELRVEQHGVQDLSKRESARARGGARGAVRGVLDLCMGGM